jgi:acyl-CoA thioesterase FadM
VTGPTELAAEPGTGRVFTETLMPGIADATGSGRVRLDALARWLQEVAYHDLLDAGFDQGGAWVVRRQRLVVESFPRFGEPVTMRTFCSGLGRFAAERRTSIRGATARVEAVALWIWLDVETLRPMRFPPAFVELYAPSAEGRVAGVRLRHPEPPPDLRWRRLYVSRLGSRRRRARQQLALLRGARAGARRRRAHVGRRRDRVPRADGGGRGRDPARWRAPMDRRCGRPRMRLGRSAPLKLGQGRPF